MDLEVDHRWRDAQEKITDSPQGDLRPPAPYEVTWKPTASISPAEKKRSSAFWFSIALAVGIILAVSAAGIAGSIAQHRQGKLISCIQAKDVLKANLNSSCSANATTPSIHDIKPTSECKSLISPFESATGATYTLECGTDLLEKYYFGGVDLMGVYVYTLTDCINACAFYNDEGKSGNHGNSTCYAVSFNIALAADTGNCWLKSHQKIPFQKNETVDSAILGLN